VIKNFRKFRVFYIKHNNLVYTWEGLQIKPWGSTYHYISIAHAFAWIATDLLILLLIHSKLHS